MKPTFEQLASELQRLAKNDGDRRLCVIFEQHKQLLSKHFDSCLFENRGEYFEKHYPKASGGTQWFGPLFHKGFRQYDVLPAGGEDAEVWELLSTGSEMFWTAAANVIGE